jgi:hypothetical protein
MKIDYAAAAAQAYARQLCRSGSRGALMTFGNTFEVEQAFTDDPHALDAAIAALPERLASDYRRRGIGEGTRLYDSMADAGREFVRWGNPERNLILLMLTDGRDNRSAEFGPKEIGRHLARTFTNIPGNFAFLVGVGRADQIDKRALATVGVMGGFPAVLLDSFRELGECFARIAHKVTAAIMRETVQGPGYAITRTTPALHVVSKAIDFALLIDRSGSMAEQA